MDEEKPEADRHHEYREKNKQLERCLREFANEMESTVETLEEQTTQLQNRVLELETQNSVLNEEIRLRIENETNLMATQVVNEEAEINFIVVAIQEPTFQNADRSFENVSEKETQTTEDIMDVSHINQMLEQNILLKRENDKLKRENRMMRHLGQLIARSESFEEENEEQGIDQYNESNSIEEENVEPDPEQSNESFSRVDILAECVDRSQLVQTDSDLESLDVEGWDFGNMMQVDQVGAQLATSTKPSSDKIAFHADSIQEVGSSGTRALAFPTLDEMETC